MKDIRRLHNNAIALMKAASAALFEGREDEFFNIGKQAFLQEEEVALYLIDKFEAEPTRSVLFRSASTMAFNIGLYKEAERLTYLGLSGNVYVEIKTELLALKDKIQAAIASKAGKQLGVENAYLSHLKEKAVNIKLVPKQRDRYSSAVVVDYMIDFLKNVQNCFNNFSVINFKKVFNEMDFYDFNKVTETFKKESRTLCVDLKFASFGVSIVADTSVMNYTGIATSDKFRNFKSDLFTDFANEILLGDFNSFEYQQNITKKYTPNERSQIFSSIIDSLKEKSNYRISIVDSSFEKIIKNCPTINKQAQSILKPIIKKESIEDDDVLLRRTFEITTSEGQKKEKILSENLDYAEFNVAFTNITSNSKQAYFINPYDIKVVFDHGLFIIDDEYYGIYIEDKEFKDLSKKFEAELISKFDNLLSRKQNETNRGKESKSLEDELSFDENKLLELLKTTIIKGW